MSIGVRILGVLACIIGIPLMMAGFLLSYALGVVRTTLVESVGLPETPVLVVIFVLNIGILVGALALTFLILLRLRRSLAARWSIFRIEDEAPLQGPTGRSPEILAVVAEQDRRMAPTDGRAHDTDALGQIDGGTPPVNRRQMATTVVSDEDLSLIAARGGELTILSSGSIRTMALTYRGRREGAMVVEGWIPSNPRRKSSVRAGLLAQGWRTNANNRSIGRFWTIGDSADRTTCGATSMRPWAFSRGMAW